MPDGWAWSRLEPIASLITDYVANGSFASLKANVRTYKEKNYALFVRTVDFANNFKGDLSYIDKESYDFLEKSKLYGGELMLSNIGASIGKVFKVPHLDTPMSLAPNAIILRFFNDITCDYFEYVFKSFVGQNYLQFLSGGAAMPKFNKTDLRAMIVPVPPIKEQERIVESVKNTFIGIDDLDISYSGLANTIQSVKSKILDLAIRGKLVPQDPNDEPASVLLERIRAEKEELIKQGKIKRDKKESVIFRGEDNSYYEKISDKVTQYDVDELPWGWGVGSFSQCNLFAPETINPSASPDEMFELYSVPNFEEGVPEIICGREIGSSKQSICEHDVLVCKINPRINRVWITGHITPYQLLGSSEWIVFRNHLLFAPYLRYYFSSPRFRELILSNVSGVGGSLMRAQPESVKKYPVFIPPYQEQIGITERINELFTLLEVIEKSLN